MKKYIIFLLPLFFLITIVTHIYADVDTKDGTSITETSNIDGFTSNIDKYDGQTITSSVSYLAHETFDPNSTDLTWTDAGGSGTWDPDYTTTVLEGTETLHHDAEKRYTTFTGTDDEIYVAFIYKDINASGASRFLLAFRESDFTALGHIYFIWDVDHYYIRLKYNAGGSTANGSTEFATDTVYYLKILYDSGSGANGIWKVYYSASPFSSWTEEISITNATDTAQAAIVQFSETTAGDSLFDDIRVNTTAGGGDTY